jgi:effector-binding domain-containing protein
VWPRLLTTVHETVRWEDGGPAGRNVMLYLDERPSVEVGVELDRPAAYELPVVGSELPGGDVAVGVHVGRYDQLGAAHRAVVDWIEAEGLTRAGPRWEIYGHWSDDAPPETEIWYLLG